MIPLYDELLDDAKQAVVWRRDYWLTDFAPGLGLGRLPGRFLGDTLPWLCPIPAPKLASVFG